MWYEWISIILMILGAFLMLVAAIGVVRLPDIYLRMAANSKAATLGAAMVLLALAIHFFEIGIATRAIAAIIFLFMTAPIAAHMLGRAAYLTGTPLWERTCLDELHGHYDTRTRRLKGQGGPDTGPLAAADDSSALQEGS
jgi:multicomponent Na+:H+ antiporter subunit G